MKKIRDTYFNKSRDDRVTAIETSDYKNDALVLPEYSGMYTIRNINPQTSDDLFYFHKGVNMIPGYVDSESPFTINLIDGRKKLVKSICNSYYHSIMDDISEIIYALELNPNYDLVLDVSEIIHIDDKENNSWDFFRMFLQILDFKKIKYTKVRLKEFDVIYMDNFKVVNFIYESGRKADLVYQFFKEFTTNPDVVPTKNVFVSRALTGDRPPVESPGLSFGSDSRMDNHFGLEDYFAKLGYDIIHAEKFNTFQEQLDYFYSAKTIVSLTGSGLTNAVFMQPGGTMVEIVTPLVVAIPPPDAAKDITDPFYVQEIHNFYKNIAFYQNHTFLAIQNPNRDLQAFVHKVETTEKIREFLSVNDE